MKLAFLTWLVAGTLMLSAPIGAHAAEHIGVCPEYDALLKAVDDTRDAFDKIASVPVAHHRYGSPDDGPSLDLDAEIRATQAHSAAVEAFVRCAR